MDINCRETSSGWLLQAQRLANSCKSDMLTSRSEDDARDENRYTNRRTRKVFSDMMKRQKATTRHLQTSDQQQERSKSRPRGLLPSLFRYATQIPRSMSHLILLLSLFSIQVESLGNQNEAQDLNSIDLKQQMELIRGATAVELGRSNVMSGSSIAANISRNQRSELATSSSILGATCGYPGSPAHASIAFNSSSVVAGTAASYTCDNGYELLGPPRRICQANGTWSPVGIPFCVLNVGLGKAAMQSSTSGQASAQRAVDGSTSPYFQASTCTMTDAESNPWWYVNLLEPYLVQIVRIDFGMPCCANRQKATIAVRVGNNRPDLGNNPLCNRYHGFIEEGKPLFLPCTRPAPGAFVSIHLESPGGSILSICETFIYTDHALSIEQCPSFRDQPLGSTATYNGKCYLFHNNHALPFDQARRYCESRGGSLVDETSPALQGFLSWELYRRHRNDQMMGQYWLGAVRDTRPGHTNNWKWINGKDVQITFWELLGSNPQGNCSRFDGSKGWLWSGAECSQNLNFICQYRPLSCGKPEKPTNSTLITKNIDNGTVIEYQCAPGNLLMGPKSRTCLPTGFFSEFAPKCKYLDCQFPAQIPNGDYKLLNSTTSYQSIVTYFCNPGYQIYGRATLSCDVDERWNGPPPRCEPLICSAPVPPTNGYVTVTSNVTIPGTQATYDCRPGYELVGERLLACSQSGSWDHSFPYCREKRSPVPPQSYPAPAPPKVHFPQSNRAGSPAIPPALRHPSTNNDTSVHFGLTSTSTTRSPASLNGLPGQFVGASQAATAGTIDPPDQTQLSRKPQQVSSQAGVQFNQVPSTSEQPPFDISSSPSTQPPTTQLRLKPPNPQQGNRQQTSQPVEPLSQSHGPLATTNSISVHPGVQPIHQVNSIFASLPSSSSTTQTSTLASIASSSTSGAVSSTGGTFSTAPSSTSINGGYSSPPSHHPHNFKTQSSGSNIMASSFQPPVRSQNSLASTKYSLDGIIATAIFGGFIFLGAIITIIVIILRRRKKGHSPSIDAQTICTFDSNGAEHNGFYRNYQQAWENLRFATAPGSQPKSSGSHHLHHHQQVMNGTSRGFKNMGGLVQPTQLHHAHLVTSTLGNAGHASSGGSSQSSSLGAAGSGGADPLIHHSHSQSHQLRAAQRRSLQLEFRREDQLVSEEEEEQGVLSADESVAIHRHNYQLMSHSEVHGHQHHYAHTNEGFRDSNELTVGPDTRAANGSNRNSRLYSIASAGQQTRPQTNGNLSQEANGGSRHSHSHSHHHHHHRHHSHHGNSSQHQRLVSSSTATTTSSPSTSTRSSRASPQSDDQDLDRLAYGNDWRPNGTNPSNIQQDSVAHQSGANASRGSNTHYNQRS